MQRGRKAEPPSTKMARGTFQPVRDGVKTEVVVPGFPPQMPSYMTAEAVDIWYEVLPRAMSTGVTEIDSALLARYCSLEALVRKAFNAGQPPPAAYLTVLRQHEELLRIAGPKSRVGGGSKTANDGTAAGNPFARNGHRSRA
jgi:hypothetical protein